MAIYVPPRSQPVVKAGPLGPGAGPLMTEPLLSTFLRKTPQEKMRRAWQMGISVPWIRVAEKAISDAAAGVEWHLEDENDAEIDDTTTDLDARRVRALFEKPQSAITVGKKLTRRDLWALTFRHMGLCGNAFWYLDGLDGLNIPTAILYIRPDRMTPKEDAQGNLDHWSLDERPNSPGTRIELSEVIQFMLQPPDEGHFGIGLVESALLKAQLSTSIDQHANAVLAAGGRLQGILSPKPPGSFDDAQYRQIINDARSITEQPDAAKRLQVLRGPVDFTNTAMTMQDAQVVDMMVRARDDLFTLWNVPPSQVGVIPTRGMNSGALGISEEAVFWQKAVHPRLTTFTEAVQYQMLDDIGTILELEIDEPEFDDDAPKFDLLEKAKNAPLKNKERRAIIDLEPFGDERDNEVWLPMTQVLAFPAPDEQGVVAKTPTPPAPEPDAASLGAGETAQKASLHDTLVRLRTVAQNTLTPRMKSAVRQVLGAQAKDVASWLRTHSAHVESNPKDRAWWNAGAEDRRMRTALAGPVMAMAQSVNEHIAGVVPAKASPIDAATRALTRGAARVTNINQATQDAIAQFIADGIDQGLSPAELADEIESGVLLDNGSPAFSELRAETIARTELMDAYNGAALASYSDAGVEYVQAIDGTGDEECAARDGQTFSVDEADTIEDHPNGTLDWVPVFG